MRPFLHSVLTLGVATFSVLACPSLAGAAGPTISPGYQAGLTINTSFVGAGTVTQMAWGPDGRLYASRYEGGVVSFSYDPATGLLDDMKAASNINGLGIAFATGRGEMYLSSFDSLWRLTNASTSGAWGSEAGDVKVKIVGDIPTWNHAVDQLQIQGSSLYVGIGTRTYNGGTDNLAPPGWDPPNHVGESAYNGTISWIQDISQVQNLTDAAKLNGAPTSSTLQTADAPYTSTDPGKLIVHSAGLRNPYGLAFDAQGSLFVTNNYDGAVTNGDGTVIDQPYDNQAPDFAEAAHDQLFMAQPGGDYGYRNDNWRGVRDPLVKANILDPGNPSHIAVSSITFDNLWSSNPNYHQPYDSANPVGLGPSSSPDGLAFWYSGALPDELRGDAFIARWSDSVTESPPGTTTLVYQDLVAADPITGEVRRVAQGFVNPLAVLSDGAGHLLVSDFGNGRIYVLSAESAVPEPSTFVLAALGLAALGCVALRRKFRRA